MTLRTGTRGYVTAILLASCGALAGCDSQPPLDDGPTATVKQGPSAAATGGSTGTTPAKTIDGIAPLAPDAPVADPVCGTLQLAAPSAPSSTAGSTCICTRRPGAGHSFQCPPGADQSASAEIGPAGGTLTLTGQQGKASGVDFSIDFPPGALAAPTLITVTETSVPPPAPLIDFSPVYLLEPRGLALAKLSAVRLPWSATSGATLRDLAIYERDELGACAFGRVGDSYTNAGFEQGSVDHLGYLFVATTVASNVACGSGPTAGSPGEP